MYVQSRTVSSTVKIHLKTAYHSDCTDTADRNYAISHYMKVPSLYLVPNQTIVLGIRFFPPGLASLREELDLYFQLCSLECCCETLAVVVATLANGGINPLSQKRAISAQACRDVLSLMYSCGMYDLSDKFAFHVYRIPFLINHNPFNRSSYQIRSIRMNNCGGNQYIGNVSILLLSIKQEIPHEELLSACGWSKHLTFTIMIPSFTLIRDRSIRDGDWRGYNPPPIFIQECKYGSSEEIRSYAKGVDMNGCDYDGRTALYLASDEGHNRIARFLLRTARVEDRVRDRIMKTLRRLKREAELRAREEARSKALERKFREQRRKKREHVKSSEYSEREDEDDTDERRRRAFRGKCKVKIR
ncbi:hypothetical protein PRIPAC_70489 [Pristionchus pacificus]|uniref:glutaminase n=1 Tax=Pristionchus pacificus TaxID=54126 RepID=A0A2A6BFM3_PRIPA|nr:hypothetical protein PRIPAC_70489 [Pristionchus pacificus]|eukprot:PDM64715.1 hypothetical protein PRIPAC_52971 [Pristionchus pacificus]